MITDRVISSVAQRQVRHVVPVDPAAAHGVVDGIYRQVADEMRMVIPPALLHSPSPEALTAYWLLLREPLLPAGAAGRAAKEAVASAVATATTCPYCVDMHTINLYELLGEQAAETIAAAAPDELADPGLRALVGWAAGAHRPGAGRPGTARGGCRAELIGVLVGFHYLCRMVNVFLSPALVPPRLGPGARRRFKRGVSVLTRPTLRAGHEPGRALAFAPVAPLPPDARWAAADPVVAAATGRAYALFDTIGERSVSPAVRALVARRVAGWRGEDMGLSRRWCEPDLAGLPAGDRAAGRLALLTALASYQVDDEVIAGYREHHPGDRELVETTAWAAYLAARRIGARHAGLRIFEEP
ncbi:carboxymuconolactone decarboxylase family protein [Actinoplanes sp. G11-F43]|uniref:carboxymuconolactone decarboxylase family protein n=1 Tax=Actinoplanes sp. G11-F43 TaxID=3424130 RepID=UPI003D344D38